MHNHFKHHFYYSVSGSPMEPNSTEHKKIFAKYKFCEPLFLCIHGLTSSCLDLSHMELHHESRGLAAGARQNLLISVQAVPPCPSE